MMTIRTAITVPPQTPCVSSWRVGWCGASSPCSWCRVRQTSARWCRSSSVRLRTRGVGEYQLCGVGIVSYPGVPVARFARRIAVTRAGSV
eukprot:gene4255-biopygen1681